MWVPELSCERLPKRVIIADCYPLHPKRYTQMPAYGILKEAAGLDLGGWFLIAHSLFVFKLRQKLTKAK